MTLPFRRRHNDAEASHDRARSLIAAGFLEPIEAADSAWLEGHLAGCLECRTDAAAYEADRQLLRSLRDRPIEPPRDLWARTAAEIERSHGRRDRASRPARSPRMGRVPLGVISGLLVVLVVIGASLAPRGVPRLGLPSGSPARGSSGSEATPIAVIADALAWIQVSPDGSYQFLQANVNEVCAYPRDGCAPLSTRGSTRLIFTQAPQSVLLSPVRSEITVITKSTPTSGSAIVVVPVPTVSSTSTQSPTTTGGPSTTPLGTPNPSPSSSGANGTPSTSASTSVSPSLSPLPSPGSTGTVSGSPGPSGSLEPSSGHAIVTGVVVVGDPAYSADGAWLAFSARPIGGTSGPDLYTWHVSDELATAVTTDHRTFFAGWLGDQIIADRVASGATGPEASPASMASSHPTISPLPTPVPPTNGATPDPNSSSSAVPAVEDHPIAFLLNPKTEAVTPLGGTDIWHPTVDPTGKSVVYWSGTLIPDGTGTGWTLGTGHLVIDGWLDGSPQASGTVSPSPAVPESGNPTPPAFGPAGQPVTLSNDPVTDFDASFDPSGTSLAIWIADPLDATIGTLRLVVLDPETRQIDPTTNPLPGVAALRGVSIDSGRLAWVAPPGQDGQGSHVQVLAWNGREFGQIRTIQGDRFVVAR